MRSRSFAFVLYARAPRRGEVKTRMIPRLDADEALALHVALVEDSLDLLRDAAAAADAVPYVAFSEPSPGTSAGPDRRLSRAIGDIELLPQRGEDLGERLLHTCDDLLQRDHPGVVVIGSDSPTLPANRLVQARAALRQDADAVIGPTEDGGYYLIGVARSLPGLFGNIAWGTGSVYADTLAAARRIGARTDVLPYWYDIDRPDDLARLYREAHRKQGGAARTMAIAAALAREGRLDG
jgi:hypothetical protein